MRYRKSRTFIQRPSLSIESEKLYKTAVLTESGDVKKIHKMYCEEVENYGGEGGAICHLKVTRHSIKRQIRILFEF